MKEYTLRNGLQIPAIGFGTWQIPEGEQVRESVKNALQVGYRHIDTAAIYGNEKGVGEAIRESGITRQDLFLTTKLWNNDRGYDSTLRAFDESLDRLGMEYVDLYLIHWPAQGEEMNYQTWRAIEVLYKDGRAKAIGVSNFLDHHLDKLSQKAEIMPMVDQIEYHPGYVQPETVAYCKETGILVEAWSPLGSGKVLNNAQLGYIAEKYGKSVAQICIRWCLQNEVLPLPKSVTPERIRQNMAVYDFTLTEDDMATIDHLPYIGGSGLDPDKITF